MRGNSGWTKQARSVGGRQLRRSNQPSEQVLFLHRLGRGALTVLLSGALVFMGLPAFAESPPDPSSSSEPADTGDSSGSGDSTGQDDSSSTPPPTGTQTQGATGEGDGGSSGSGDDSSSGDGDGNGNGGGDSGGELGDSTPTESPSPSPTVSPSPSLSPSPTASPSPSPSPSPSTSAEVPDVGTFSLLADPCSQNCSTILRSVTIVGGSASPTDWEYRATITPPGDDWYDIPETPGINVDRTSFVISSVANAGSEAENYTTTVLCSAQQSGIAWSAATSTLTFSGTQARTSTCTFTHTFVYPEASAVIKVKTGADRVGVNGVSDLSGVVLHLNGGEPADGPNGVRPDGVSGDGDGWARCVSDANGWCTFTVPSTQENGANRDSRFWVVQPSSGAPGTWYTNTSLRVGGASGDGSALDYVFLTGSQLRAGNTYSSTSNFMISASDNDNSSGGIWQQSRNNPDLTQTCGLNVALILDISGSVGTDIGNLRAAANKFVDSLVGTPSNVALFSFNWVSPGTNGSNYPTLYPVGSQAQADVVKARYAGWSPTGGTNWDNAFAQVADNNTSPSGGNHYDIAVIITDGNPTTFSNPYQGTGSDNRFRETENGIFSANAVKAEGTRVIAFGVGAGANGGNTTLNLRSISGSTVYNGSNSAEADFYQTTDYAAAGDALRALALGNCQGTLTVTKQIVPEANAPGDTTGSLGGIGWEFTSTVNTVGVTPVSDSHTTSDASGTVAFPLTFPGGTDSAAVQILETPQSGFNLFPVGGQNAVCRNITTNESVALTGNPTNGFAVDVPSTDTVNCVIYNQIAHPAANIRVDKSWVVNGVTYANGSQPGGISAELSLTGPNGAGATPQQWGIIRTGFITGGKTTLSESVTTIDSELCTVDSSQITEFNGATVNQPVGEVTLTQVANTATITNTVTCRSELTLVKQVQGGTAAVTDWTLNAQPPAGQGTTVTGVSGSAAATSQSVTPNTNYQLFETGGDARYRQVDNRSDTSTNPLSTGSATCIRVDANGNAVPGYSDGSNGGVRVPLGYRVECTFVNQTAQLLMAKHVVNNDGGTAVAADWTLTATPDTMVGLSPASVTGAETPGAASTVQVRPDWVYTLTESGPASGYAYALLQERNGQGQWQVVVSNPDPAGFPQEVSPGVWKVRVSPLDSHAYRFVNSDVAPQLTLVKTVSNTNGGTAVPTDWTLSATSVEHGSISGASGSDAVTDQGMVSGVVYTLGESNGPAGYSWDTLSCTGRTDMGPNSNTLTLTPGEKVTCTFNNADQPGTGTITKTVQGGYPVQNTNGSWTIVYDITVTNNTSAQGFKYQLTDQLRFGAGINPTAASWTGPTSGSFAAPLTGTQMLNSAGTLAPGASATYTVTATATIANGVGNLPENSRCEDGNVPDNGGFLNAATMTVANTPDTTVFACAPPAFPGVAKVGNTATQNGDATWNISYTLTASNADEDLDLQTVLSDTFPAAPAGWTLQGGSWAVAPVGTAPAPVAGSFVPGAATVWSGTLPADTSYSYTISGVLAATATAEDIGSCRSDGGLVNLASITSGEVVSNTQGCVSVNQPVVLIDKSVSDLSQRSDGTWDIVYTVTATNSSDELAGLYSLTDTLNFGGDITVLSATWSAQGTTDQAFESDGSAVLATNRVILADAAHTYTVNVQAEVTAAAWDEGTTTCYPDSEDPAGGFLNEVTLTVAGDQREASACAEPLVPEVEKSTVSVVDNADGTQTISYLVTVTPPEIWEATVPSNVVYQLEEQPDALPVGVTISGNWTATAGAGTAAPSQPTWDGTGVWNLVDSGEFTIDEVLDGAVHTYTVSATVRVTAPPVPESPQCGEVSDGYGLWNTVELASGSFTTWASDCGEVHWDDVGIVKTANNLGEDGTVDPGSQFDYQLTVTNHGTRVATNILVSDTDLNPRLQIDGLTVAGSTWHTAPGYVGRVIELTLDSLDPGASATVTVTVTFLPADTETDIPHLVGPDAPAPVPPPPVVELLNTACVAMLHDGDPTNNCADAEVPTWDVSMVVFTRCILGAPLLGVSVAQSNGERVYPVEVDWVPDGAVPGTTPASVEFAGPAGQARWVQEVDWPGVDRTPDGVPMNHTGWRPLAAADYAPGGGFFFPGTSVVMTHEEQASNVYNGMIIDPTTADFPWRGASTVSITVAGVVYEFAMQYPTDSEPSEEDPEPCGAVRHAVMTIDKTASVQTAPAGSSFNYSIAMQNISPDSAADGVVLTDTIPSDLKVTGITWPGKGDSTVFPNWSTCAVTGANSAGYGGNLKCDLFGPLQPAGAGLGPSSPPVVTLAVTVNPNTAVTSIKNTAVVNYYTFGDPEDSGQTQDDVTVSVPHASGGLPRTGDGMVYPLIFAGAAVLLAGGLVILLVRRRRQLADIAAASANPGQAGSDPSDSERG